MRILPPAHALFVFVCSIVAACSFEPGSKQSPDVSAQETHSDAQLPDSQRTDGTSESISTDSLPDQIPLDLSSDQQANHDLFDQLDTPDLNDEGLPDFLHVKYSRPDDGDPITAQEKKEFTLKILKFLKKVRYFDYVLYTTHGVDASTGKPDWQFWYSEQFRKDGDKVTFYHPENLNDGGHNLHIPFSRVLGDILAAHLLWDDPTVALASEKLCKGMSASMLGMVHDEDDPVPHLMSRNIAAFNHEFLTHDGKKKAVDYSGWFSPYERWNCSRFAYENNPYWGKVWVTNMRSKDDVPHIFRLIPVVRYVAERSPSPAVKEACGQTLTLLEAFAKDIVDSDQRIRTKDANGEIFFPGFTGNAEADKQRGDLASFIHYLELIPNGECNARRSAELIGYHAAVKEDCGRGEPNMYDQVSFQLNSYNGRICRYFHVAHLANALVNQDDASASLLLDGLNERFHQEKARTPDLMKTDPDNYRRDLALFLAQSQTFGFPLTNSEARMVQSYYGRAVDEMDAWPYWDPWAASVPDGDLGGYRPPSCKGEGEARECWFNVEDLAQVFETCWSPFINPAGASYLDCEIVKDPSKWEKP